MKKIISIAVVLVTVFLLAFYPSIFPKESGEEILLSENDGKNGNVSLARIAEPTDDACADETTEYVDSFGGYPDPATFNGQLVRVKKKDTSIPYNENAYYPTVLMYHCVNEEPYTVNTSLFVRPSELEAHFKAVSEKNIETLFADEFGPKTKESVIFTFDDGYEDNYTNMFPLAKKYNVKVTIYMIGYKIDKPGYLTSEQIKEMSDSGLVQFGSHTLDHPSLVSLSEQGVREQFSGTSWLISEITGKPVTTVAYPSGDYNDTVMEVAREFYSFAYTTDDDWYWGQDAMMLPRYAVPRGTSAATVLYFIG